MQLRPIMATWRSITFQVFENLRLKLKCSYSHQNFHLLHILNYFLRRHRCRFSSYAISLLFIDRTEKSCLHSHACWEGWNVNGNRDHHASYTRNSRVFICSRSRPQLGKWRWYKGKSKGWWVQVQGHRYCLIIAFSSIIYFAYPAYRKWTTFKVHEKVQMKGPSGK